MAQLAGFCRRFLQRVPFAVGLFLAAAGLAFAAAQVTGNGQSAAARGTQVIKLTDRMTPDAATVRVGQPVLIGPTDGRAHVLGIGKGSQGEATHGNDHEHQNGSEIPLKRDEAFQISFDKPGIYYYHDHDNPKANVAIVVTAEK